MELKEIKRATLNDVELLQQIRRLTFYETFSTGNTKKNGFVKFDQHIFKLGNDEQIDMMMKLHLK